MTKVQNLPETAKNSEIDKGGTTRKPSKIDEIENFLLNNYEVRINVITNTIEKRPKTSNEPFTAINDTQLKYELFKAGYTKFDGELKALLGSEVIHKYDPFKEYFGQLPVYTYTEPDYIKQLCTYVQTNDQTWFEIMFKKMLVRVVSQALGMPQFNKQCFTLVGKQGDGKTSFFDFLVPPALRSYYKKNYDFHGGRHSKFSLVQNFIINLDELAQFDKKDLNNEFKATLSENYVKYAPLFSSTEVSFARRASFVATTNKHDFLSDETGSVRWVIFEVSSINHDNGGASGYAQIDIDRVWAQAYALFMRDFKGDLTPDDISQNEILNRRFMRVSAEMEVIAKHFVPGDKNDPNSHFQTASTIEKRLRDNGYGKLSVYQIGHAMKMLGFQGLSKWNAKLKYSEKGYFVSEYNF